MSVYIYEIRIDLKETIDLWSDLHRVWTKVDEKHKNLGSVWEGLGLLVVLFSYEFVCSFLIQSGIEDLNITHERWTVCDVYDTFRDDPRKKHTLDPRSYG